MRRTVIITLLFLFLAGNTHSQAEIDLLAGSWLGSLDVSGVKLRLVLKVEKTGGGYAAKLDSIDQGAKDLPVESISLTGRTMNFSAPQFGMSYEGTFNDSNEEIAGTFKQRGGATAFVFKRTGEIPAVSRRQDPKKPFPYQEEEVSYSNVADNVKLTGTLTMPRGAGKRHPVVLLISGSGSQNRDSLVAGHRPFLVLADHLTRSGIAVLRVDDRGTGSSDMGSLSVTSENFMHDVLAGVAFLKSRKDIDPRRIGLIGHSEGGMIASMAAAGSKDIAFIVMMAGPGQTGDDLIQTQTDLLHKASGSDPETTANAVALAKSINAVVKTDMDPERIGKEIEAAIVRQASAIPESQRKQFDEVAATFKALMPMFKLPWYRYFISFDPAPVLRRVKVPVLTLNGELDLQVSWKENLGLIAASLKAGKNKDVTVKSFPKLNHLFQTSKTGQPSEYAAIDETISPEVLGTISDWIRQRTIAPPR